MPKTIVVPLDGSDTARRAVDVARRLAGRLRTCELVVVTAIPSDDESDPSLASVAEHAAALSARFEVVRDVEASDAIVDLAGGLPDAVVCMATHGRGRLTAPLLGSTATAVLRRIEGPMVLVGPHFETTWCDDPARILVCWGGAGSEAILPVAGAWADDLGADMWLASVFHPLDTRIAVDSQTLFDEATQQLGAAGRVEVLALRDNYPAGALVHAARDLPATLVALTTHARTGVRRAVLGSVALDIVHNSPCPVLVVRRDGRSV